MCWTPFYEEYYPEFDVPVAKKGTKKVTNSATMETAEVFDYFKETFGLRSKLPATNEINALLKFYTVDDLKLAAKNARASKFFMDHNATRGPKWFYGKAERVEHYLNTADIEPVKAKQQVDMIERINQRTRRQETTLQAKSNNLDAKSVYVDELPWS